MQKLSPIYDEVLRSLDRKIRSFEFQEQRQSEVAIGYLKSLIGLYGHSQGNLSAYYQKALKLQQNLQQLIAEIPTGVAGKVQGQGKPRQLKRGGSLKQLGVGNRGTSSTQPEGQDKENLLSSGLHSSGQGGQSHRIYTLSSTGKKSEAEAGAVGETAGAGA